MGHHAEDTSHYTPEEKKFHDFIHRGDDFFKIHIYRLAKEEYLKALELNVHNDIAESKIKMCKRAGKTEVKIVSAILAVAAVIVAVTVIARW